MIDLKGKRVLVYGAGISGVGSAVLLEQVGAQPVVFEGNPKLTQKDVLSRLPGGTKAEVIIAKLTREELADIDLAVVSPGVPCDSEDILMIKSCGIPLWGEIELAYACGKGDVLAITGTNGKTTTTTLLGAIMRYHMERRVPPIIDQVFVVGNIGTPYTGAALDMTDDSVTVAEISSFQLETIDHFHPVVSAITNITPDHLNRHHTMEEYIRVKLQIARNQTKEDFCVLNYEDEILRKSAESIHAAIIFFSSGRSLDEGYCLNGSLIEYHHGGQVIPVVSVKELHLPGKHNYENVMTATAMAYAWGVPMEEIRHVLRSFTAVEHRIEYVAQKQGVIYYNDSKATNPEAAIRGIEAMDRPTVLIGGGYDKDSSYDEWIRSFAGKVRYLVLTGDTKTKIAQTAKRCGFNNIILTDTFEEAFSVSAEKARPGDAVLLSPACASWGMFPNYEVRGRIFKAMVNQLPD